MQQTLSQDDKQAIRNYARDTAQRIENGRKEFAEWVQKQIHCTQKEAFMILEVYRAEKIVKLDKHMGRFNLIHGAYADADVLQRALSFAKEE